VLAKAGQNLGGTDIDRWLLEHFQQTLALPSTPLTQRLVERLKVQLSSQPQASEVLFDETTFDSYDLSLDRDRFTAILQQHQFFERLDDSLKQVLQQARRQGVDRREIDAVLLVGGTTQMPAVQQWIAQYFEPTKIRCEKPFEAIAQGALHLAQGIEVRDFLYHSYGVRYWDRRQNCHNWHPIIHAGQPYPMPEPLELVLGASVDNQPNIELILGELGASTGGTEVYFDGDRLLTRHLSEGQLSVQPLNNHEGSCIAPLNPPGFPGSDRIKVQFRVDDQRLLRISIEDLFLNQVLITDQVVAQLN
jgi:molecular chaperone DnaK (HSP70)